MVLLTLTALAVAPPAAAGPPTAMPFEVTFPDVNPCTGLMHTVTGSSVVLGWDASAGATAYSVEVGSSAGLSDLFNATAGSGTSLVASGVAAGRYFVRVRGVSACGVSGPSSEIVIDVGSE